MSQQSREITDRLLCNLLEMLPVPVKRPSNLSGLQRLKFTLFLLVFLGGEDQALPAAEGEAGGDAAGGTGCALQEQRHQRFCKEPRPQPESQQQPCPRQPQPEAEGAGCQGDCWSLRPPELSFHCSLNIVLKKSFALFFLVSASADAHLQQGVQPGEQQCQ